jgi:hypothetical protein
MTLSAYSLLLPIQHSVSSDILKNYLHQTAQSPLGFIRKNDTVDSLVALLK